MSLLYTKMKVFHFKEKLDSLPLEIEKVLPPLHIRIKPTNICGHNCWYCAYRADNLQLGQDMVRTNYIPKDKMMEIIEDIIDMQVKAVTFSGGGDPFTYPYLLDAVRKLSDTSVKFAALTNASKLDGEAAKVFAHNAIWLRVSIDGWDSRSYAEYRRVPEDEFKKVMNNIENFSKLDGGCHLGVSIIVDRKNASHIYDLARMLKNVGVNSVKIAPCIVSNDGKDNNKYHKPIFSTVKDEVRKAFEELADDNFEVFDSYHGQLDSFKKDYAWCPFLQILPVIGADMNVYPCQDKAYNLKEGCIGSIKYMRFKDFWYSDKSVFFKINPSLVCNHHCVANEKNRLIFEYLKTNKGHLEFV